MGAFFDLAGPTVTQSFLPVAGVWQCVAT